MEEMKQLLFILGAGIPTIGAIGLFMIKKIMDMSEDIAALKAAMNMFHPK